MSRADAERFHRVLEGFKGAMGSVSSNSGGSTLQKSNDKLNQGSDQAGKAKVMMSLPELKKELSSVEGISVSKAERVDEVLIRLNLEDLFSPGEFTIRPEAFPVVDRIGRVLIRAGLPVRVEGHTDLFESKMVAGQLGWELSSKRAIEVTKLWQSRLRMDLAHVSIMGHAHFRPLVKREENKESEEVEPRNRRVEIVVSAAVLSGGPR